MMNRRIITTLFILLGFVLLSRVSALPDIGRWINLPTVDPHAFTAGSLPESAPTGIAIRQFEERVEHVPGDAVSQAILGQLRFRQGRQTGDIAEYEEAESRLRQSLAILPDYAPAQATLAAVLLALHEFDSALALSQSLYDADPNHLEALAVVGDAQLALGRYQEAEAAYRTLAERASSPAILARLANLAELQGNLNEAIRLTHEAAAMAQAGADSRQQMSWYLFRLGDLYFDTGQVDLAGDYFQAALRVQENFYPVLADLGKVAAAQGRYDEAISRYEQAAALFPALETEAALADLYAMTGQPRLAAERYREAGAYDTLAAANPEIYGRELARYLADHNLLPDEAVRLAEADLQLRQDIYAYDTLAWAYYKDGRYDEARAMMDQALMLGTQDPILLYHAGMIARSVGDQEAAIGWLDRALAINPQFDLLQAPIAGRTLAELKAAHP